MEIIGTLDVSDLAVAVFFIGLYGAMTQRNMVKTIMSIGIMDLAAITFLMLANYAPGARPPIEGAAERMTDPVSQALMITAIVIGVSVTAMCLAMFMRIAYRYGTGEWDILIRRKED